jgi:hypothetical protein
MTHGEAVWAAWAPFAVKLPDLKGPWCRDSFEVRTMLSLLDRIQV